MILNNKVKGFSMFKKLTMITVVAMLSSTMSASESNLWKSYKACSETIDKLARHGSHAITQQEKDVTAIKIQETLRRCLLIVPDKTSTVEAARKRYKLVQGDPATPSYHDEYEEVGCHAHETPDCH
jgi:hypothetical protein